MWWKKKRPSEQSNKTSLPQLEEEAANDTLAPREEVRRYGRYDGDLTQGDEGIDDPA